MPTDRTVQLNYISDIHLEWLFDKRGLLQTDVLDEIYRPLFRCNRQPATQHNLLMIAGDLTEARKFHYFVPFVESVIADNGFDKVFYVMGNHEYYGDALHKVVGRIQAALDGSPILKAHMSILHNQCAMLDNGRVQIIGAPFWYQVAHGDEYAVAQRLSDYRYIKVKRRQPLRQTAVPRRAGGTSSKRVLYRRHAACQPVRRAKHPVHPPPDQPPVRRCRPGLRHGTACTVGGGCGNRAT